MDEQPRDNQRQGSRQDSEERRPSFRSLDRYSSSNRKSSNRNRGSLIQVMSLEGSDMKDDIYQYYLIDENKRQIVRKSNNSRVSNSSQNSIEHEPIHRRPSSSSRPILHDCGCDYNNCLGFHCSCYNEPNQICLLNSCCPNCIKMKNQVMQSAQSLKAVNVNKAAKTTITKCVCEEINKKIDNKNWVCMCGFYSPKPQGYQKTTMPKLKSSEQSKAHKVSTLSCSCKKSQCLKKYCCCCAVNQQCSAACQCEQCLNRHDKEEDEDQRAEKQRHARVETGENECEIDIEQYLEDKNYENEIMPASMEFEYPDLKNSFHY